MKTIYNHQKLTLLNFESQINRTILQRGRDYYNNGAVVSLEEYNGTWHAEVEGSDNYEISVSLLPGKEIDQYHCDCPYDGDICKHLVAVFFQMREETETEEHIVKKESGKNQFDTLLNKININEYQEFIKQYAAKDKSFKAAFELFFADKDDTDNAGGKYVQIVQKTFKKFTSFGYVDYQSGKLLAKEVDKLIGDAQYLTQKNKHGDAFAVISLILTELTYILSYADDSSGAICERISDSIAIISQMVNSDDIPVEIKHRMFDFLKKELQNDFYFDFDFGDELFECFKTVAFQLNRADAVLEFINAKIADNENDGYWGDMFIALKIDLLKETGNEIEAEHLIEQHLDIESIRQIKINEAITEEDFEKAKLLIAGGIELAESKKYPGNVIRWETELLNIAVLEKDITLIRYYCKKFAFISGFDINYYIRWKQTYTTAELPAAIAQLIEETVNKTVEVYNKNSWGTLNSRLVNNLAPIYIEEKYLEALFNLVKQEIELENLMRYHSFLYPEYSTELFPVYLPALERYANNASDRGGYAHLVRFLQTILNDIPDSRDEIMALVKSLKLKYARRPAMMDELSYLK